MFWRAWCVAVCTTRMHAMARIQRICACTCTAEVMRCVHMHATCRVHVGFVRLCLMRQHVCICVPLTCTRTCRCCLSIMATSTSQPTATFHSSTRSNPIHTAPTHTHAHESEPLIRQPTYRSPPPSRYVTATSMIMALLIVGMGGYIAYQHVRHASKTHIMYR